MTKQQNDMLAKLTLLEHEVEAKRKEMSVAQTAVRLAKVSLEDASEEVRNALTAYNQYFLKCLRAEAVTIPQNQKVVSVPMIPELHIVMTGKEI